nr:caspase family protein [Azospirillum rugosum]
MAAERRVALVIGNGRYDNGGSVPGAATSARTVTDALRKAGFEVVTQYDLNHRNLTRALSRFQEDLARADLGAFYYAGMVLSLNDKSFIIPSDARLNMEVDAMLETIELDSVLEQIQNASYRSIVAFDPIVPNPMVDRLATSMGANGRSASPLLATTTPRDRMIIAFGQRPGSSPVPTKANGASAFAAALAEEIVKPGVPVKRALQAADQTLAGLSGGAQRLWFEDRLDGDLVLVPAAPPPAAPAPTAQAPTPPPATTPSAVIIEPFKGDFYTTRKTALFKDPDAKSPRVRTLDKAAPVSVTAKVKVGKAEWMRIEEGGRTGYVQSALLTKDAPAEPPPKEEAKAPQKRLNEGDVYVTKDTTAMRDRPEKGARSLRTLERGAPVTVAVPVPEGDWVKVRDVFWNDGYVPLASLSEVPRQEAKQDVAKGPPPSSGSTGTPPDEPLGSSGSGSPAESKAGDPFATLPPPIRSAVASAREATQQATAKRNAGRTAAEQARSAQKRAQAAAQDGRSINSKFPNGDSYRGQGDGPTKTGFGVYRYGNGGAYEGEWKNDAMTGAGVYSFPSGERFEGTFANGSPQGAGTYHFPNGDVFTGEIRNGRPNGAGEVLFGNGDRYLGTIADMQPEGMGTMTFRSGDQFVGTFRNGLQNGPGVRIAKGGSGEDLVIPGVWQGSVIVQK